METVTPHRPDAWLPDRVRVVSAQRDSEDMVTLVLEKEGPHPYDVLPGQFFMIYLHGTGEIPISVSRIGPGRDSMTHTVRAVGPVSRALYAFFMVNRL